MTIRLIAFLFMLTANVGFAQDKQRYIFIEKNDGSIEYHLINNFKTTSKDSSELAHTRLYLFSDKLCLHVKNYRYSSIGSRSILGFKKSYNDIYDQFGVVLKEKDIQSNGNPDSCLDVEYKKIRYKPGASKVLRDQLNSEADPEFMKDLLKMVVSNVHYTPQNKICSELLDMRSLIKALTDSDFLKISHDRTDIHKVLPTLLNQRYTTVVDKLNYFDSKTKVELTDKAQKLMNSPYYILAQTRIQSMIEQQSDEVEVSEQAESVGTTPLLIAVDLVATKRFLEKAPENKINYSKFLKNPRNRKILKEPRYIRYLKKSKSFIKVLAKASLVQQAADLLFKLYVSGTDPLDVSKKLNKDPLRLLATETDDEAREACGMMIQYPPALRATYEVLNSLAYDYYVLKETEALSKALDKTDKSINDLERNMSQKSQVLNEEQKSESSKVRKD